MVLGSTVDEKGRLLFYRSADLIQWEYVNYATAEGYGWMWECPDYFRVDGADVLIFSPTEAALSEITRSCKIFPKRPC